MNNLACSCLTASLDRCPTHGTLQEQATALRLRLDCDRNDPSRRDLYAALHCFSRNEGAGLAKTIEQILAVLDDDDDYGGGYVKPAIRRILESEPNKGCL